MYFLLQELFSKLENMIKFQSFFRLRSILSKIFICITKRTQSFVKGKQNQQYIMSHGTKNNKLKFIFLVNQQLSFVYVCAATAGGYNFYSGCARALSCRSLDGKRTFFLSIHVFHLYVYNTKYATCVSTSRTQIHTHHTQVYFPTHTPASYIYINTYLCFQSCCCVTWEWNEYMGSHLFEFVFVLCFFLFVRRTIFSVCKMKKWAFIFQIIKRMLWKGAHTFVLSIVAVTMIRKFMLYLCYIFVDCLRTNMYDIGICFVEIIIFNVLRRPLNNSLKKPYMFMENVSHIHFM